MKKLVRIDGKWWWDRGSHYEEVLPSEPEYWLTEDEVRKEG